MVVAVTAVEVEIVRIIVEVVIGATAATVLEEVVFATAVIEDI